MNRKARRLICEHLDRVYTSSAKLSQDFGLYAISLSLLKEVIELNKMKADSTNVILHEFIAGYNSMLDQLYKSSEEAAKLVGSKYVSRTLLKMFVDTLKENL